MTTFLGLKNICLWYPVIRRRSIRRSAVYTINDWFGPHTPPYPPPKNNLLRFERAFTANSFLQFFFIITLLPMSVYYHNLVIFEIVEYNTVVEILSRNENGRYEEVRSKRQKKNACISHAKRAWYSRVGAGKVYGIQLWRALPCQRKFEKRKF